MAHRADNASTTTPSRPVRLRWRLRALVPFVVVSGLASMLLFADGAPGLVRDGLRASGFPRLPYSWDVVGHVVLWFAVAFIAWWTFARRISAAALAVALVVASYGSEIGQAYLTTTRRPDVRDLAANGLGIAAGLIAAALWSWVVMACVRSAPSQTSMGDDVAITADKKRR
ncbi:MAG: hypothetical protein AAGA37_15815 [Actinomycetota bacterium]